MHVYEKNLLSLKEKNPLLALQLLTSKSVENIRQLTFFPHTNAEVLYIVGLGDESWLKEALNWINTNKKRSLIFLEENLASFHHFLSFNLIEKVINHPRIRLIGPPFENTLLPYVWSHLHQPWECYGYDKGKKKIEEIVLKVELTVCLYRDFGIPQLMNVFNNILVSQHVRNGEGLFGKFNNVPAIICGAGPSLEDHLIDLKKLTNHALIIGGGSALIPLSQENVFIHFAAALDPESPKERFFKQTYFEVPLFYQNQISSDFFLQFQGPKLCLGESSNFLLEKWLELPLNACDIGWNVSTFSTQIAYQLGCNPIIFLGMDLCVSNEKSYAGEIKDLRDNKIDCIDRFGNFVKTRPDFLMAKKWLESFAASHKDRTFLNATTRGLALEGIKNAPLHIDGAGSDLKGRVHQAVQTSPLVGLSNIPEKLQHLYQSLCTCQKLLGTHRDIELEGEIFYRAHLLPNWEVWKHFLQTEEIIASMQNTEIEKKLQQTLFFKEVTKIFKDQYERKVSI